MNLILLVRKVHQWRVVWPLHLHGRDGGDRRHTHPGHAPLPGDPRRDRPGHRHLRRPGHRLGRTEAGEAQGRPFSFVEAALFQWVNPKAWVCAVGAVAAFTRPDLPTWLQALALTAALGTISLASCALYLGGGVGIGRWLASPLAFRLFNLFMGGLTIASVALLFL